MAALCSRRTRFGAIESTNEAIRQAGSDESAQYIRANWLPEIEKWGHFARDHSPLLLQVTTTNPIEAFHRSLKSLAKLTKLVIRPKYSLAGIISLIRQCALAYDARAQKAAYNWSRKKLSAVIGYPWLDIFPYQVQLLLLSEIKLAEELAESGTDSSLQDDLTCHCRFARSYFLPCRHIILAYHWLGVIEEPNWDNYASQFDESGYEIYWTKGLTDVVEEQNSFSRDIEAKLHTNEALDQVRTRFFELSELAGQLNEDEKNRLFQVWEQEVLHFSTALVGSSLDEWVSRARDPILF
jgi:hypothetical protein